MTLDQLKVLIAVVDAGGFRAASDVLHRSQSAVSIAIRKLEEELGLSLFSRDDYRPVLTEEGQSLYRKAKRVLAEAAEFSTLAQHFTEGFEPELRIAMTAVAPVNRVLDCLKQISDFAPGTRLTLLEETLNGTMERLDDGEADIAITESNLTAKGYDRVTVSSMEFVSVIAAGSELAHRAESLKEEDMTNSTQVIVRDTARTRQKMTAGVLDTTNHWTVNDFAMKKRIILSGLGWGGLPRHMVEDEIRDGKVRILQSDDFKPFMLDIKMVRRKDRPVGPVAEKFWQLLRAAH